MSTFVVFFGGYQATQDHIDAWLGSAGTRARGTQFIGFPWPKDMDPGPGKDDIQTSDAYKSAVAAIQASSAGEIYIVGHSSGCAIANAVDSALKDTSKVSL